MPENRREQVDSVTNAERKMLINNCLKRDVSKRFDSMQVLHQFDQWSTVQHQPVDDSSSFGR